MARKLRSTNAVHRVRDVAAGAVIGACLGGALLLVGVARFAVATLDGSPPALSSGDRRMMAFYVGGFALAGALLGLVRPLIQDERSTYFFSAIAGAVVTLVISAGSKGGLTAIPVPFVALLVVMGAIFGIAFARGFLRS